jgi:hypothetical protein
MSGTQIRWETSGFVPIYFRDQWFVKVGAGGAVMSVSLV